MTRGLGLCLVVMSSAEFVCVALDRFWISVVFLMVCVCCCLGVCWLNQFGVCCP